MEFLNIYLPVAGSQFNIGLLLLIGFSVGVLGGFFGVGGAWIVTPALNIFGFPMSYAIGTDFAHIYGKSIVATTKHHKMGNVDWKLGITSIIGTIPGVESGASLVMYLEKIGKMNGHDLVGNIVRWTYIVFLLSLSIFMMYDYYVIRKRKSIPNYLHDLSVVKSKKSLIMKIRDIKLPPFMSYEKSKIQSMSVWTIIIIFFFCGFISGFLGVGGGFIRMPALVYLLGCPTAIAVGTDLFVIMIDGAYGCFSYALKGRVEIIAASIMLVGAAAGAQLGVTAVKYIRGYGIRILFAFMVLFAGISVIFKQMEVITSLSFLKILSSVTIIGSASIISIIILIRLFIAIRKEKRN